LAEVEIAREAMQDRLTQAVIAAEKIRGEREQVIGVLAATRKRRDLMNRASQLTNAPNVREHLPTGETYHVGGGARVMGRYKGDAIAAGREDGSAIHEIIDVHSGGGDDCVEKEEMSCVSTQVTAHAGAQSIELLDHRGGVYASERSKGLPEAASRAPDVRRDRPLTPQVKGICGAGRQSPQQYELSRSRVAAEEARLEVQTDIPTADSDMQASPRYGEYRNRGVKVHTLRTCVHMPVKVSIYVNVYV